MSSIGDETRGLDLRVATCVRLAASVVAGLAAIMTYPGSIHTGEYWIDLDIQKRAIPCAFIFTAMAMGLQALRYFAARRAEKRAAQKKGEIRAVEPLEAQQTGRRTQAPSTSDLEPAMTGAPAPAAPISAQVLDYESRSVEAARWASPLFPVPFPPAVKEFFWLAFMVQIAFLIGGISAAADAPEYLAVIVICGSFFWAIFPVGVGLHLRQQPATGADSVIVLLIAALVFIVLILMLLPSLSRS